MMKRLLIMAMSLGLIIGLFGACSGSDEGSAPQTNQGTTHTPVDDSNDD